MYSVDAALQRTCASFREQAAKGEITRAERDLLIDGAVLLAVNLAALPHDALADLPMPPGPDVSVPERPDRRGRPDLRLLSGGKQG